MHALVCVKQVPDTSEVRIDPRTNTMIRAGVPSILNPDDVHAVEESLRLRDRFGGKITAITMGPGQAREVLREAVAMGVDEAVLISDRHFAGADTLATSYALWGGIRRIMESEPIDIILCGRQAIDGDTGQVPPGIAVRLGWPPLTYVRKIEHVDFENRVIRVQRQVEGGRELLQAPLPAVVAVMREINEPRYASLANMIRAARYQPLAWDRAALGLEESLSGIRGSPTIVSKVWAPAPRVREPVVMVPNGIEDPEGCARELAQRLASDGIIKVA